MAIKQKNKDVIELENHMLGHCKTDELRDELRVYFKRYPFSVVDEIIINDEPFAGVAHFETGGIELNKSLLDAPSGQALHVYLHECAHIIAVDGHTLGFAVLTAGLQQHFCCRDTSRRRLSYDTQDATVDERQTAEFAHLRRAGSVRQIAEPERWIERRRASQEALAAARWREQNLWPAVAGLIVSVVAVAGIVAWPWISEVLSNEFLAFSVGFVIAAGAILLALLSVNNT